MNYTDNYDSPIGPITLASDGTRLIGLWFDGQKYDRSTLKGDLYMNRSLPIFAQTKLWLNVYFSGQAPDFTPPLKLTGSSFKHLIATIMLSIPFGQITTYGQIAKEAARLTNRLHISAQAVGGAVGHNPISIIVPCHRVVAASGNLTGYAGGIDKKIWLLNNEHIDLNKLVRSMKATPGKTRSYRKTPGLCLWP